MSGLPKKLRYNSLHRDLSTPPLVPNEQVETLIELPYPPGNVAVSPDGRIFFDLHPFAQPKRFTDATVFELVDGSARPFPDADFQARFNGPLGMTVDQQNRLWIVEPQGLEKYPTRLLGFDLNDGSLCYEFAFTKQQSRFAQDMRVSPDGRTMYLADTGIFTFVAPRLIVLDLEQRTPRTVLTRHPSVRPQRVAILSGGRRYSIGFGAVTFRVGVDGIALSQDGAWLYFATMNHDTLYRVPTSILNDPAADETVVARHLESVATKPLNDGIDIDSDANVYLTDIEHGGTARISRDGTLATLTRSDQVIWPDGVVLAPSGEVIFTDSAIPAYIDQLARPPKRERIEAAAPYRIYRFTPPPA
jgi:hypothetical protein